MRLLSQYGLSFVLIGFLCSGPELARAQTDPRKPSAIEVQDVPAVPAELVAKLAQYQSVRGASLRGSFIPMNVLRIVPNNPFADKLFLDPIFYNKP